MSQTIALLAALLLIRFVGTEAQFQRARRRGDVWYFPPGIVSRLVTGLGGPFWAFIAYKLAIPAFSNDEWFLPVLCTVMAICTLLASPPVIRVDPQGIAESRFLRLRRSFPWAGAGAEYVPGLNEVLVVGANGTVIKHGPNHVGQLEFLSLLRRHGVTVK